MIRINLLPVKEAQRRASGVQLLLVFAALILVEIAVLFYISSEYQSELRQHQAQNAQIEAEINKISTATKQIEELKPKRQALEAQRQILLNLIEGKTGPVKMLDELALMLTPIDDPVQKVAMKARGWTADWDPTRLWIENFVEDEREVKLQGMARSNDDLAELLKRLNTSRHFHDVRLNVSEVVTVAEVGGAKVVSFDISAVTLYGKSDLDRFASKFNSRATGKKK